jgi:hypothetical protein
LVRVEFADGGVTEGDVLVGADGVHSTIRTQLHPDEGPPLWNGITMWRAVARAEPFLSGATVCSCGTTEDDVLLTGAEADGDVRDDGLIGSARSIGASGLVNIARCGEIDAVGR